MHRRRPRAEQLPQRTRGAPADLVPIGDAVGDPHIRERIEARQHREHAGERGCVLGVDFRAWIRGDGPMIGELPDDREDPRRWKSDHPPDVITASYSAAYDEARLRRCLAQLTEAVHALHRHGC